MGRAGTTLRPLALVFALSGCAGLVHEVAWARVLGQSLGNSLQSLTAVLVAFLGGLGAGAAVGARLAGRSRDPLRLYAVLEGLLALYASISPALAAAIPAFLESVGPGRSSPASLTALRFVLALAVLAIPTLLMGATWPCLVREAVGRGVPAPAAITTLYGVNTVGAALGALAGSFAFLPFLGTRATFVSAGLLNALACVMALSFGSRRVVPAADRDLPAPPCDPFGTRWAIVATAAVSGAVGGVLQVGWTRVAALAFGSSVYALGITLACYVLGLGAGPLVAGRWISRPGAAPRVAAAALACAGLSSLLLVPIMGRLPVVAAFASGRIGAHPAALLAAEFGVMGALLLIPSLCQGAIFPSLAAAVTTPGGPSRAAAALYTASTWGSVAGLALAGLVALPTLGTRWSLLAASATSIVLALVPLVGLAGRGGPEWIAAGCLFATAIIAPGLLPGWDSDLVSGGGFLYGPIYRAASGAGGDLGEAMRRRGRIVFSKEDGVCLVTVRRSPAGVLSLQLNGKTEASTGGDMSTQLLSAHLPLLLHPSPADVLVIGLASGVTLGAAERHPVRALEVIEIAPGVPEAARLFDAVNGRALDNPRVTLVVDDARSRLLVRPGRFDVITSQPSNPWVAGVSNLFTVEFYRLIRRRLNPGGLFCQWVQAYRLSPDDFRGIVRSFIDVFPEATLWEESAGGGDYFLLGGDAPLRIDPGRLAPRGRPEVWGDLRRAGIGEEADLLSRFVTGPDGLRSLAAGARRHTDDTLYLETSAPLAMFRDTQREQIVALRRVRRPVTDLLHDGPLDPALAAALRSRARERDVRLEIAASLKDGDLWSLRDPYVAAGIESLRAGLLTDAIGSLSQAAARNPESGTAPYLLGEAYRAAGLEDAAAVAYREAIQRDPGLAGAWNALGRHLAARARTDEAAAAFEKALQVDPGLAPARNNLGGLRLQSGDVKEAESLFLEALESEPDLAAAHANLGLLLKRRGDFSGAERRYREALALEPLNTDARYNLAALLRAAGRLEEARRELARLLEIDGSDADARKMLDEMRAEASGRSG